MLDWISLVFIDEQLESSSIAPHDQIISELHLAPVEAIWQVLDFRVDSLKYTRLCPKSTRVI